VPEDLEEANCIDLVVVRTRKEVLQSSFLSRYLNSQSGRRQVLANLTGMAQKHLNIGAVRRTLVPIPPLSEQIRIVEWLSVVDSAKKSAQVRANTADTLRRTLLDNLMTGRLRANNLEVPT
jgi:type I restriction enzyme S subunit